MKKILITTALMGAFAMAQETTPAAAPSNHSIFYTADLDYKLNGKEWEGEHLVWYKYKFADGYAIKPTVSFWTKYEKTKNGGKDWKTTTTNQFVELRFTTPKFWDILGFKTGVELRYTSPTGKTAQLAGSYGGLKARLIMEKEFNAHFNVTIKPKLTVNAQRNGHAVRAGAKEDRNDLVRLGLEILPQWKFNEDLTLTYDVEAGGTYIGNGSGGEKNLIVKGDLYQEVELMYNIKAASDLGVGLIVVNDDVEFGNHNDAKPFKGDYLWAGMRVQKNFDL